MATNYSDNQNTANNIAESIAMIQNAVAEGYTVVDLTAYGMGTIKIPISDNLSSIGLTSIMDLPSSNTQL